MLGTLLLIPTVNDSLFGLAQRIFIATWLSWTIAAAAHARKIATASEVEIHAADLRQPITAA